MAGVRIARLLNLRVRVLAMRFLASQQPTSPSSQVQKQANFDSIDSFYFSVRD
jgi:hypothetical protein